MEIIQPHITLTLDGVGRQTMPGDLCQQRAGHPFDAEGEGCVLDRAGMAQVTEHPQKAGALLRRQAVQQVGHPHFGVAQLGSGGNHSFRFGCMGNQGHV